MKQRILAFLAVLLLLPGLAQAKIFLVDTDDTLRVVTASGVSTMHMYAAWADITTTALTPGNSDAQVTTATTTVLVAAPGSSTQRQIKGLSIRNAHVSSSNLITVQFFDGATATELIAYTLLAGETLQWGEDENFRVIDASGQVKGAVALATGTNSVGQVTANAGTNLNTSSLLTTTAHDAAFGTAGSADAQVRTVQGIASMTPLQVQSNSANLATAALQDGIIKDGTGDSTQANVSSGSLHVACQSGCSGGTQYAEDSAHASGDTVTMAGVVRSDAAGALAADGDRSVLQVDDNGYLKVVNNNPNLAADNSTLSTAKTPVLPCTANASAPSWTEGRQVPCSTDLAGAQRVAGTVTANAGTNLNTSSLLTTTAHDAAFGTAGSADAQVRTVQGIASMTPVLTNPGTAANIGVYIEDAAETAGGNLAMAGSVRRDTAASSAGTTGDNATINTDATGLLWTRTIDPCSSAAKTFLPINISSATTTELTPSLAGASTNYYVCSLVLVTNATNIVTLVDDDSDGCGSPTSGLSGGTTTAGWTLAANGGLSFGNGMGSIFKTGGANRVICLVTSATTQLSGTITVVAAP